MRSADSGWKRRRTKGTEVFQADLLQRIPWLIHGFSTRVGLARWDTPAAVAANRTRLLGALGAAQLPLATLRQVHSDVTHVISTPPIEAPSPADLQTATADAALTRCTGVLLSVQTADCVPILLADKRQRIVAAVHAGWRGTLARITVKTLGRMRLEFGTRTKDVVVVLGPAIGRCCYQVGPEVAQAYAGKFPAAVDWFDGPFVRLATGEDQNWLPWLTMMPPGHLPEPERVNLDLRAANRWQLLEAGVSARHIATSTLCTRCRADLFFSYRRDGAGTGRMLALIGIREGARRAVGRKPAGPTAKRKKKSKRALR